MDSKPNYRRATNMAYKTLLKLNISDLPITVMPILERFPYLRVYSYREFCKRCNRSYDEFMQSNVSDRGFIFRDGKYGIICYNDEQDPGTIRFTLAHELGHYVLKHTEEEDSRITDREANCFARNFLSPVPVTERFDLNSINDCFDIFDITPPAAEVVLDKRKLDRMNTDAEIYKNVFQLFGLRSLTKDFQLKYHSARTMRAALDFAIDWDGEIGTPQYMRI